MNKKTIYALLLGTGLIGCEGPRPTETKANESKALYIPTECKDIITLTVESHYGLSLTCKDEKGKEFHYKGIVHYNGDTVLGYEWKRYEIVRQ